MSKVDKSLLNDVKVRFLSLPKSVVEGLEQEPKKSDFDIIKELGVGNYGTVYLVSHKKTKAQYALKAIDKTEEENIKEKVVFNREIEIMYKLNHPNIVKLYGHFEEENYCYFIMQYIPNKSLFDLIPETGKKPNIKLVASVMKDVLKAIYYLHNMKPTIIHRDIKPENILLDQNNKAYLTDFGWSNYMDSFTRRTTFCGTPLYLPPEIIQRLGHDETVDIWCVGVLLFELVTGETPFEGNDMDTVCHNIVGLKINWPNNIDADTKDLIINILKPQGKDRLTIEQILNHKFFCKYFPNAVKELIKPEVHSIPTFVVSTDDPKDYGKEIKRTPILKQTNDKTSINNTSNNRRNTNVNINYGRVNNINTNTNYNRSSTNNDHKNKANIEAIKIKIRSKYTPKENIDLSSARNSNNTKPHPYKISINTSYNSKYSSKNNPNTNTYNRSNISTSYNNDNNNSYRNTYKYPNRNTISVTSPTTNHRKYSYIIQHNVNSNKNSAANTPSFNYKINSSNTSNAYSNISNANTNNNIKHKTIKSNDYTSNYRRSYMPNNYNFNKK